ncbi:MAG: quinolinate synthase NadA [Desulfatibacillaceae bacterium]
MLFDQPTEAEIKDATEKVRALLDRRKAILLAHNYQPPWIQDVADMCGDSLELSRKAAETDAEVIVFAGVHFMAETASILCPDKTVLLPRQDAGCPMADMITARALEQRKSELPGVAVVTYVNSPAAVKALTDVCCTSANVVAVVNGMDAEEILMVPDRNLARYAARYTEKHLHYWDGYCPFHDRLTADEVKAARLRRPDAVVMAHPECRPEVVDVADKVTSTSGMLEYPSLDDATEFIVATEVGILYPLSQRYPDRKFHAAADHMVCEDMKRITLTDVATCLENMSGEVRVPEEIRRPALAAVERMIRFSG